MQAPIKKGSVGGGGIDRQRIATSLFVRDMLPCTIQYVEIMRVRVTLPSNVNVYELQAFNFHLRKVALARKNTTPIAEQNT